MIWPNEGSFPIGLGGTWYGCDYLRRWLVYEGYGSFGELYIVDILRLFRVSNLFYRVDIDLVTRGGPVCRYLVPLVWQFEVVFRAFSSYGDVSYWTYYESFEKWLQLIKPGFIAHGLS